jgi:hypothetical protein
MVGCSPITVDACSGTGGGDSVGVTDAFRLRRRRDLSSDYFTVTGQVGRPGSDGAEFLDQVVGVSHEALDGAPSLLFGGSDERSDQREILCTME